MEQQIEIQKQFREQQERYTYYLIALCVAAIGYSINIIRGLTFTYHQIFLFLSFLPWVTSVYLGLKRIKLVISILFNQDAYLKAHKGTLDELKENPHPDYQKAAIKEIRKGLVKDYKVADRIGNWQYRLFLIGFLLFIIWALIEMYIKIFF